MINVFWAKFFDRIKLRRSGRKSGMTLIESLVAITLLVMGFAGAFKAFLAARSLYLAAKDERVVTQLAQSRIERLEMIEFQDLSLWGMSNLLVNAEGDPSPEGRFQITTSVTPGSSTNELDIAVSVSRRNRATGEFSVPKEFITTRFD